MTKYIKHAIVHWHYTLDSIELLNKCEFEALLENVIKVMEELHGFFITLNTL